MDTDAHSLPRGTVLFTSLFKITNRWGQRVRQKATRGHFQPYGDLHYIAVSQPPMDRDDDSPGAVDEYDLRVSYDSITAENFAQAFRIDSVADPAPAGVVQQCVIDELEPDSTYYFAIKSRDGSSNWSGISNCCKGTCPGVSIVVFADAALEQNIRDHLNKPVGDILSTDVDTILYVDAAQAGIVSLGGLEFFASLQGANLWGNEISDITPLAATTQVWGLSLGGNNISDLSPLAGRVNLHQLHIGDNPITNLWPLSSLTSLQQLFIPGTLVTDFSPLYGLEYLHDVHFGRLNLTNISFISNLTHLTHCILEDNDITLIAPLSTLTSMEMLGLTNNNVSDISPLASLVNLSSVNLNTNMITDIQALVDNTGLGTGDIVSISSNPLSQHAIDVQIPALEARGVTVNH
jgi:hypothetical protein